MSCEGDKKIHVLNGTNYGRLDQTTCVPASPAAASPGAVGVGSNAAGSPGAAGDAAGRRRRRNAAVAADGTTVANSDQCLGDGSKEKVAGM